MISPYSNPVPSPNTQYSVLSRRLWQCALNADCPAVEYGKVCSTSTKVIVGRSRSRSVIIHKFLLIHHRFELGGTDSDSDRRYLRVTISALPDDVLLEIFVHMVRRQVDRYIAVRIHEDGWRTLVHVCKPWRSVVFSSPRCLDLQLVCTNTRPVKKLLDIWPPLPIHIFASHPAGKSPMRGVTNVTAALEQHHRVCGTTLHGVPNSLLKKIRGKAAISGAHKTDSLVV